MKYTTIIADIINSKEITNREKFQDSLKNCLDKINRDTEHIISPYTITLGDEFQAIYINSSNLINDIFKILLNSYPAKIRFSIGIGDISTKLNYEYSLGMDGPAFHIARKGLKEMKNIDYSLIQVFNDLSQDVKFINTTLRLSMAMMSDWKNNTFVIFNKLLNDKSVSAMLPSLDITERAIYKIIKNNNLREYVEYFSSLKNKIHP